MNVPLRTLLVCSLFLGTILLPGRVPARQALAGDALLPLDLRQVKAGGEIGRRIDITIEKNILQLNLEQFLPFFQRKTSTGDHTGSDFDAAYIGLGKLIGAAVELAANTGNTRLIAWKEHLVSATIATQLPDGYLGIMAPSNRMWTLWDIHEMSYLILALTQDYHYFGKQPSLDAARKAADYLLRQWPTMPAGWPQTPIHCAPHMPYIGLECAMLTLYGETKDARYLRFCTDERRLPSWDLDVIVDRYNGHAYAYLNRCLAQLLLYRIEPDKRLLSPSWPTRRAIQFMTGRDGMCISGGTGQGECWSNDQNGSESLGETCATAYELRVFDNLLRLEGESRYGDLIERAVFNALFGAQSPDGRQLRYYVPFEGPRVYFPKDTFCCPGNYRRIVAELPAMIYYRSGAGLAVNLYTPSTASLELAGCGGLRITQTTDYPNAGHVVLQLVPSRPAAFPLKLRIPKWCQQAAVSVNGQPWQTPASPGTFLTIERAWMAGDRVTLDMPMTWRLVRGRKSQSGYAAVIRGPLVYCLDPAQCDLLKSLDVAALKSLVLYPHSLRDLPGGDPVQPGGMACQATVAGTMGKVTIKLTQFPDPQGRSVYFRLPDLSVAAPDELSDEK